MKKFIAFLCMLTCILSLAACESNSAGDVSGLDENALRSTVQGIITQLETTDDAYIESFINRKNEEISTDTETALAVKSSYQSWLDNKGKLGAYQPQDTDEIVLSLEEDGVMAVVTSQFEKRPANITVHFDTAGYIVSFSIAPVYTKGEIMKDAALNTIMGIGTVFAVLIFIAFIISLFKYISKAEKYFADRKYAKETAGKDQQPAAEKMPVVLQEAAPVQEEELVDDLELVAVITAALAASMNTSVDQLVVRSIKRKRTNKWQKA